MAAEVLLLGRGWRAAVMLCWHVPKVLCFMTACVTLACVLLVGTGLQQMLHLLIVVLATAAAEHWLDRRIADMMACSAHQYFPSESGVGAALRARCLFGWLSGGTVPDEPASMHQAVCLACLWLVILASAVVTVAPWSLASATARVPRCAYMHACIQQRKQRFIHGYVSVQ